MHKIDLKTEKGDYVTTAVIQPYTTIPVVIVWGTRVFTRWTDTEFRECFAVAAVVAFNKETDKLDKI